MESDTVPEVAAVGKDLTGMEASPGDRKGRRTEDMVSYIGVEGGRREARQGLEDDRVEQVEYV